MMGQRAKIAARVLATAGKEKTDAIYAIAQALLDRSEEILEENRKDLEAAKENGLSAAMLDRLALSNERIAQMADGARQVAAMSDPVGRVLEGVQHANGMSIRKVTVPLGVIGIIFEARPNVTSDAAVLCIKAGNVVILRGGKEAILSNRKITEVMRAAVKSVGLPEDCIQLICDTSRQSATELMGLTDYLDVLIPRGGAGLIRSVVENSRVPVLETGAGNCHIYVDKDADEEIAVKVIFNAKTSRPSVCNACEKVLVHKDIAASVLPKIEQAISEKSVEIRGCSKTVEILADKAIPATEEDWDKEYLDYIVGIRVVDDFDEAVAHIGKYSTGHSEAIITENYTTARKFEHQIDAAAVYVNASTRFTDGGVFGLGAEIGISTQKLHARGPMGVNQLVSAKYIIEGTGQVR